MLDRPPPVIGIDLGTACCRAAFFNASSGAIEVVSLRLAVLTEEAARAVALSDQHGSERAERAFARVKSLVESHLGEPVGDAVIPVPVETTSEQSSALIDAARRAGLRARLVPAPVAAAVGQLGLEPRSEPAVLLVYSLGATSFSAAVVRIEGSEGTVFTASGDPQLGGAAFDTAVAAWAADQVRSRFGLDCPDDGLHRARLRLHAERARIELSSQPNVMLRLHEIWPRESPTLELSREQLEELIAPLLAATMRHVDAALQRAEESRAVSPEELDGVVLAGGATLMPRVREELERVTGARGTSVPFVNSAHPQEASVRGAALLAQRLDASEANVHRGTVEGPDSVLASPQSPAGTDAAVAYSYDSSGRLVTLGQHPDAAQPAVTYSYDPRGNITRSDDPRLDAPAPSAPGGRRERPVAAPHLDQNVQFTTYCPRVVKPEKHYTVLAFAHLEELPPDAADDVPDPVEEVRRQAREILGDAIGAYRDATLESAQPVPREAELTFVFEIEGFRCNPPRHTILWEEPVHRVEFRIKAPAALDGQTCRGRLSAFLGDILLAEAVLRVDVSSRDDGRDRAPQRTDVRPYRRIFASYSRRDLAIVEQFERYAGALGDRYLRDLVDLRSGEEWNEQLMRMIEEADVFQLFWSASAMRSPFVRQEWEYALSLGRRNFIRPMYWEQPFPEEPPALPPDNLRAMHFKLLGRYRAAKSASDEAAQGDETGRSAIEASGESFYHDDGFGGRSEEEAARRAAEECARKVAEERVARDAEERARHEASELARREALEHERGEVELRARREAEDRARRDTELRARHESEDPARREALERAHREALERLRHETEHRARREEEAARRHREEGLWRKRAAESLRTPPAGASGATPRSVPQPSPAPTPAGRAAGGSWAAPPLLGAPQKSMRRSPALALGCACLALAALIGLAVLLWMRYGGNAGKALPETPPSKSESETGSRAPTRSTRSAALATPGAGAKTPSIAGAPSAPAPRLPKAAAWVRRAAVIRSLPIRPAAGRAFRPPA